MKVHWLEKTTDEVPISDDWLSVAEQKHLLGLRVPKRRNDWRLGRWTAKLAVAHCLNLEWHSPALVRIEVRASASGAPSAFVDNAPADFAISISHRAGRAVCAVAPFGTMLGCDLEIVEPRSGAFISDYFTADEQEFVARGSFHEHDRLANVIWSAKESALKAMGVGLRADSRAVSVAVIEGEFEQREYLGSDWNSLIVIGSGGETFHGWWQQEGSLLRTMVSSPAHDRPHWVGSKARVYTAGGA